MVFVCKQTDAQPNSKEKLATFNEMKCKVNEQTQKGVRRVKNDKRRGRNFTMEKFLKQRVNLYSWPSWNVRVALER